MWGLRWTTVKQGVLIWMGISNDLNIWMINQCMWFCMGYINSVSIYIYVRQRMSYSVTMVNIVSLWLACILRRKIVLTWRSKMR